MAKDEIWYLIRILLKDRRDISWFKNIKGVMPQSNEPDLFLILRVICFFHSKLKRYILNDVFEIQTMHILRELTYI